MSDNTSYELVHRPTPGELSQAVQEKIDQGWWPLGTPFVHGEHFIQAMVFEPRFEESNLNRDEN